MMTAYFDVTNKYILSRSDSEPAIFQIVPANASGTPIVFDELMNAALAQDMIFNPQLYTRSGVNIQKSGVTQVLVTVNPAVRTDAKALYAKLGNSTAQVLRAFGLVLIDEINLLREWIAAFKATTALATTLADFKTRVAALPAMPDRTPTKAQVFAVLDAKIDSSAAD